MNDRPQLEKCSNCKQDIGIALTRYFWGMLPGNEFEFTCPNCGIDLSVKVEPEPRFYVTKAPDNNKDFEDWRNTMGEGREGER